MLTKGQAMSIYHSKILRIPHGNQLPAKRYLTEEDILKLFAGKYIHIQEKVDGKLNCMDYFSKMNSISYFNIEEDMSGKNTCHKHYDYNSLPITKKIPLDIVAINDNDILTVVNPINGMLPLDYCIIDGTKLTIKQIYGLLELLSNQPSHFGRDIIEGLVIKNYDSYSGEQLFGKWICDEFEDHLQANSKR